MSGLVKGKEYKVEDSNVEGIGSTEDRDLRKKVAKNEPAWRRWESYMNGKVLTTDEAVKDSKGKKHHVEIWRIEKFKVKFWPREQHGSFHSGDSYLILHTFENAEEKIQWDLHFWLGTTTTQDEMGTAAYKTVELDTLLDDGPVQKREVQDHESDSFHEIFTNVIKCGGVRYLEGGVDTGFNHVEPERFETKLLHLKGKKKVRVTQMPAQKSSLNEGDVFVLDKGLKLICWIGKAAGMFEKNKARELMDALSTERRGRAKKETVRQGDDDEHEKEFMEALEGNVSDIRSAEEGGSDDEAKPDRKELYRISDASGTLKMTKEASGADVGLNKLDSADVFVLDIGTACCVWVGTKTTQNEKDNAIKLCEDYLKKNSRPAHTPITRILEGQRNAEWDLNMK